jgi:hypothetical protein
MTYLVHLISIRYLSGNVAILYVKHTNEFLFTGPEFEKIIHT